MRRSTGSLVLTVVLTALTVAGASAGCAESAPPAGPVGPPTPPVATPPTLPWGLPPASAFPPLARPGAAYVADLSLYGGAFASRLVLYEGSGNQVGLQSSHHERGFHELGGRYTRTGSAITFAFDGWGTATGTLRGDSLHIRYDERMRHSDFADGVYVRAPVTP